MTRPVSAIRNLGPRSAALFARAGLNSAEQVEALGAFETYRRLREAGLKFSLVGLYALHAGLEGRDWRALTQEERQNLRAAAEAMKRPEGLEAALDRLGLPGP